MYKFKVKFTKEKNMIYISHLDVLRLFQRSLRRAELPYHLSEGFNSHPKLSITKALSLGKESLNEEVLFYLDNKSKQMILKMQ